MYGLHTILVFWRLHLSTGPTTTPGVAVLTTDQYPRLPALATNLPAVTQFTIDVDTGPTTYCGAGK